MGHPRAGRKPGSRMVMRRGATALGCGSGRLRGRVGEAARAICGVAGEEPFEFESQVNIQTVQGGSGNK